MAASKKKALKELDRDDMRKKLAELRLELAKDRAQIAIGASPANPGRIRETRRAIARMLTATRAKEERMLKEALTPKGSQKTNRDVVGTG